MVSYPSSDAVAVDLADVVVRDLDGQPRELLVLDQLLHHLADVRLHRQRLARLAAYHYHVRLLAEDEPGYKQRFDMVSLHADMSL